MKETGKLLLNIFISENRSQCYFWGFWFHYTEMMSYEIYFRPSRYIKKKKLIFWSKINPRYIHQKFLEMGTQHCPCFPPCMRMHNQSFVDPSLMALESNTHESNICTVHNKKIYWHIFQRHPKIWPVHFWSCHATPNYGFC